VRLFVWVPGVGRHVLRLLQGRSARGERSVRRETVRDFVTIVAITIVIVGLYLIAKQGGM
jgi:hypothetical protein